MYLIKIPKYPLLSRIFLWKILPLYFVISGILLINCSPLNRTCEKDEECGWGFFCRSDKRCQVGCRYSIECAKGELCQSNQCVKAKSDDDKDGFPVPLDCDDKDRFINPSVAEICNNKKDDNCDGQIDEEGCIIVSCRHGETQECYDGKEKTLTFVNSLCHKGKQTCNSKGSWGDCQGQILPSTEICDGLDSDCDGFVDENEANQPIEQSCYSGLETNRGQGICSEGKQLCIKGKWSKCKGSILPTKEICNAKDDDCNGKIDDLKGLGSSCETTQKGLCKKGIIACDLKKKESICRSLVVATDEICGDHLDNDCDGRVDNGCPYVGWRVAGLSSYPHAVAVSNQFVAVSLKDSSKVVLLDITKKSPFPQKEYTLTEQPFGIVSIKGVFYVIGRSHLFKIDPNNGLSNTFLTFQNLSQEGELSVVGDRILSHFWQKKAQNKTTAGLCRIDTTTSQKICFTLQDDLKQIGSGITVMGVFGLLLSDKGLHFIDFLQMKEEPQKQLKLPSVSDYLSYDKKTHKIVISALKAHHLYFVDMSASQKISSQLLVDTKGQEREAGHLLVRDGIVYVSQRDNDQVSVIDLQQEKITHQIQVGLSPHGMAFGTPDSKGIINVWVTCAGDNSLWRFSIK